MILKTYKDIQVRLPAKQIARLVEMIIDEEAEPDSCSSIHLIFTDNRKIKSLNADFRHIDKATDVLSFNIDRMCEPDGIFGEIYISVPFAVKQAHSYKASLNEELLRLTCHGLLHLFGHDHIKAKDEKVMKKKEDEYLNRLFGVAKT